MRRGVFKIGLIATAVVMVGSLYLEDPRAEEPPPGDVVEQCYLHEELSADRLLRRLSLDLRGYVPEYSEYAVVDDRSDVPEDVIDAFIASDDFRVQMRRFHESILWTNPTGVSLSNGDLNMRSASIGTGDTVVWFMNDDRHRTSFRGGDGTHVCQDLPQDQLGWDVETGLPIAQDMGVDADGPWSAEGWVEVHPYWESDPSFMIKVCAFDAQANETYTLIQDDEPVEFPCNTRFGIYRQDCGCGPNLNFCMQGSFQNEIWASMREQLLLLVDDHSDGSRPYSELLTTQRAHYDGPLMHFKRYLASGAILNRTFNDYHESDGDFPETVNYWDKSWLEIERSGAHAGVLTLPAFTLRFQTNRGRANRFRIAFTGQYFQPPDVADNDDCAPLTEDLTNRCVCRKCHETLEPLAAYFGQVAEAGSAMLSNFTPEYASKTACNWAPGFSNGSLCNRFYTQIESELDPDYEPYRLLALEWADAAHPAIEENFATGPVGLATWAIDNKLFARAMVKNLFAFFFHRDMNLDPSSAIGELALLDELTAEFAAHDSLPLLVKRLVSLPQYRMTP